MTGDVIIDVIVLTVAPDKSGDLLGSKQEVDALKTEGTVEFNDLSDFVKSLTGLCRVTSMYLLVHPKSGPKKRTQ